jgi:ankyrin repeat protein
MAQLLLEHGANVNDLSHWGRSAMHLAVENGQPTMVQLLLDYGAWVKSGIADEETPLR